MLRLLVIAIVSTFLLIPIAGYSSNIIQNETLLIMTSVMTGYVIVPAILLKLWPVSPSLPVNDTMFDTLMKGQLVSENYHVQQAVAIEEVDDEGLHYLLAVDSDKTLYLNGQYLYDPVERGEFPSTNIHVFRNRQTGSVFGIDPQGTPVSVSTTLPPLLAATRTNPWLLDDYKLLECSLDAVVDVLKQQQTIG